MPAVTFYLLPEHTAGEGTLPVSQLACDLAARFFRQKQKVFIYCEHQNQAEEVDELLWQRPVDGFIPHNLAGEGPEGGAPVEIAWQAPATRNRTVCINLHRQCPDFARQFRTLIDFVPAQDQLKQQARERYKHYRSAGFFLDTQPAAQLHET